MSKSKWGKAVDAYFDAEYALRDACGEMDRFDNSAPRGGQKAFENWMDNGAGERRADLEYALLDAAVDFINAHGGMTQQLDDDDGKKSG